MIVMNANNVQRSLTYKEMVNVFSVYEPKYRITDRTKIPVGIELPTSFNDLLFSLPRSYR